jgi:hypothetical protein
VGKDDDSALPDAVDLQIPASILMSSKLRNCEFSSDASFTRRRFSRDREVVILLIDGLDRIPAGQAITPR